MSNSLPRITVPLASPVRKTRCEDHRHTGELPCPWPSCENGVPWAEFETQLFGVPTITHRFRRRQWSALDGGDRYCWDLPDQTSWLPANVLVSEELSRLLPRRSRLSEPLYHYTDLAGLFGIVSSNHLWLTDYQYLNDASELKFSLEVANRQLEQFDARRYSPRAAGFLPKWKSHLEETVPGCKLYVTSFSEDGDNLSLWNTYGRDGGVSLGFQPEALPLALMFGSFLDRVTYSPFEQRLLIDVFLHIHLLSIEWDTEKGLPDFEKHVASMEGLLSHRLLRHLAFIKDPGFSDEREIRVAYIEDQDLYARNQLMKATRRFRISNGLIKPYVTSDEEGVGWPARKSAPQKSAPWKLPLERVVVCPQPSPDRLLASIREFLAAHRLTDVEVVPSDVPYRR